MAGEDKARIGITGSLETEPVALAADSATTLGYDFYVGPKEFSRLESFEERQDLVMQFGFFGFFSKLLLQLMNWIYGFLPNYGVAIIITTLIIKTILWPLTAQAASPRRRMAKIQEPLKAIREKHKDNPQKQQAETLALFKANKINPLGGCLPIFVQIPIFFGLFRMLQSASELRFAEFLWIADLSAPDTLARIAGFPINLLPLFMGVTMFYQMKMMPTPTVDNMQAKMFKFMPFIFLVICYNFSSGLVLYWTVQNLFTIGQQYLTNRRPDPGLVTPITDTKKAKQVVAKKGPQQEKKLNRGLPSQPKAQEEEEPVDPEASGQASLPIRPPGSSRLLRRDHAQLVPNHYLTELCLDTVNGRPSSAKKAPPTRSGVRSSAAWPRKSPWRPRTAGVTPT